MWTLIAGVFMGWAMGGNNAADLIGPVVESKALRFWIAAAVASAFVIIGAMMVGSRGFATYGAIGAQTIISSFIVMLASALTVTLMTVFGLPVSGTQAVVGAIVGVDLLAGGVNVQPLVTILLSWVLTPLGGLVAAYIPYKLITLYPHGFLGHFFTHGRVVHIGLLAVTCYAAYSFGANNVANVTGVYVKSGLLPPFAAALVGSTTLALGILTFSRKVIRTVGSSLVTLDHLSALFVILGEAITLNVYALLGVPVSASQAVVGAVVGIGLVKGVNTINTRALVNILYAWVGTTVIAGALAVGFTYIARLIIT